MSRRFEMRLSDDLWDRIERARGDVPRATWIKRALESVLGSDAPSTPQDADERAAKVRSSVPTRAPDVEAVRAIADAESPPKLFRCPKATCPHVQDEPGKCPWHPNLTLIES
jgi:hypothetical protein